MIRNLWSFENLIFTETLRMKSHGVLVFTAWLLLMAWCLFSNRVSTAAVVGNRVLQVVTCSSVLRRMQQHTFDDKSTLDQVMAWCRQQQAIIWTNVDPDLCRDMASVDQNKWNIILYSNSYWQRAVVPEMATERHTLLDFGSPSHRSFDWCSNQL